MESAVRKRRMTKCDRQLAEGVIATLKQLQVAIRDQEFPLEKLQGIEPVLKRAHAILVRDRFASPPKKFLNRSRESSPRP